MFRSRSREKCEQLLAKYYGDRKFHGALYRDLIHKYLAPGQRVLDAGCGHYLTISKELSGIAEVVGIDLESQLETDNRMRPFAVRGDLSRLPFPNDYFDMIVSQSVVEHLTDPPGVFREFCRVLRPGGKVVIATPNKYDYVSIIAALTPYRLHQFIVSRAFRVAANDVFPTVYRANTRSAIRRALISAGFACNELETVNHYPAYLMFSPVLFRIGVLYERLTSLEPFRTLRGSILCVFEKATRDQAYGDIAAPRFSVRQNSAAGVR